MGKAFFTILVTVAFSLSLASTNLFSQDTSQPPKAQVTLVKLAPLVYPALARQSRITGEVEVYVELGHDGQIQTTKVTQGHPLLAQAAVDSAQRSLYECVNCPAQGSSAQVIYRFELGQPNCADTSARRDSLETQSRVTLSLNAVSIFEAGPCGL